MWSAHTTNRCNFQNTKKLETNSKRKINETYEQNSKDVDHIDNDGTNSEESVSVLWRSNIGISFTLPAWSVKKINYVILDTAQQNMKS